MSTTMNDLIEGYRDWIIKERNKGWTPYYVNLMFNPLKGPPMAIAAQMREVIENSLYLTLCKQLDRHPGRKGRHQFSPHVILFPDLPTFKHAKQSLGAVTLNGGLHYNGFISISPQARLRERDLGDHFEKLRWLYKRHGLRADARSLTDNLNGIVDYSMKTIKVGRVDYDNVIILPKS
jgi:hypothetical protein